MAGAPDFLAADVEKFEVDEDDGVELVRARPKQAERVTEEEVRGAAVRRALRICLDAVRRLRLTADMMEREES